MSDGEIALNPVEAPSRKTLEEWAGLKGLDPRSWVFAAVRTQFGSVIGAEASEDEFDKAVHVALYTPHTA
jgi:hypothetical protein